MQYIPKYRQAVNRVCSKLEENKDLTPEDIYRMLSTKEEYESRQDRYDKQLKEFCNYDPAGKSTEEKIKKMREYRMDQFEKLTDAVYKRRGWTKDGIPTIERLKEIGMDLPELIELIKPYQN